MYIWKKKKYAGTSLVVQWVRLPTPNAGGLGSIPGQGTRSRTHAATKSPHATTKSLQATTRTWSSQNKLKKKKKVQEFCSEKY